MRVRMAGNYSGSVDGVTMQGFADGEAYDLPASLAKTFVDALWAVPCLSELAPVENKLTPPKQKKKVVNKNG